MLSSRPWCGYRRLSQDRTAGRKIGPEIQTDSGARWVRNCVLPLGAAEVDHWYQDTETAGDEQVWREEYEQMLVDLAAGVYGGVVAYRCDRLTRLTGEFDRLLKAAARGNAEVAVSDENLRSGRPDDVTMMKFKVVLAEAELKGMKVRIKANKRRRSEKGFYNGGGNRPYGFEGATYEIDGTGEKFVTNSGRVGVVHVAEETANIQEAARRIAWERESYTDVIKDWHSRTPPIYGSTGSPWNPKTLETVLTALRMVGKRLHRSIDEKTGVEIETEVKAVWEPVLDIETWEQLRRRKRTHQPRGPRQRYLLSGLLKCGRCGRPLTGCNRRYFKDGEMRDNPSYRCKSHPSDKARGACGRLNVLAEPVEKIVVARALHWASQSEKLTSALSAEDDLQAQYEGASVEIEKCDAELEELQLLKEERGRSMSLKEYMRLRDPIVADRESAQARSDSLLQRLQVPIPTARDRSNLVAWFEGMSPSQSRKFLEAWIGSVSVAAPGRSGRYFNPDRVTVTPAALQQAD